jgi:phospholipase/lecithinase/hemolysin
LNKQFPHRFGPVTVLRCQPHGAGAHLPRVESFLSLLWAGANQNCNVKSVVRFTAFLWFFGCVVISVQAFTSLYVFGDGVSTTTNNYSLPAFYYGHRFCNGRVWVEVLAERQGITYESNKNWSYYGHYSPNLVANVNGFPAPTDALTSLFVVWVNDADFVDFVQRLTPYTTNNLPAWTSALNQSLTNHFNVVTNLYGKGARTLIMPKAVDLMKVPQYSGLVSAASKSFIRQRVIDFNAAFTAGLSNTAASLPGLTIYVPDFFALLDDAVAHPMNYGFTNATSDALDDGYTAFNGPGTNYVFWDYLNPTAKFQMVSADIAQQLMAPVRISNIVPLAGTNRLIIENTPVGRNGFVDASTNFANWTTTQAITSSNTTQTILVSAVGPWQFYRLRFPFSWTWP